MKWWLARLIELLCTQLLQFINYYFRINLLAVVSIKLKVYDDKLIPHVNLHYDFARFNLIRVVEKRGGLLVSGGIWQSKKIISTWFTALSVVQIGHFMTRWHYEPKLLLNTKSYMFGEWLSILLVLWYITSLRSVQTEVYDSWSPEPWRFVS